MSAGNVFHCLPRDILLDILSRLSIEDISQCKFLCKDWYRNWRNLVHDPILLQQHRFRFKDVYKFMAKYCYNNWCSLVSDPAIPKLHSSRFDQLSAPNFLVLCRTRGGYCELYLANHDENSLDTLLTPCITTRLKIRCGSHKPKVVGSSNGLLCLVITSGRYQQFFVCNPLTGETLKVPPTPRSYYKTYKKNGYCFDSAHRGGFVFDATTNTYKVIRTWHCLNFTGTYSFLDTTGVEIYTLGSGRWRTIKEFPNRISEEMRSPVFLNGALHWMTNYKKGPEYACEIFVMNVGEETFKAFPFKAFTVVSMTQAYLCLLGDCLAVVTYNCRTRGRGIWVMNVYGEASSWEYKYHFDGNHVQQSCEIYGNNFDILSMMSDGRLLLEVYGELGYYDSVKCEFRRIVMDGTQSRPTNERHPNEVKALVHIGSFVSPLALDGRLNPARK